MSLTWLIRPIPNSLSLMSCNSSSERKVLSTVMRWILKSAKGLVLRVPPFDHFLDKKVQIIEVLFYRIIALFCI